MGLHEASRRALIQGALACIAIGLLAFAATDALQARLSYQTLDAAREASPTANWRPAAIPVLPGVQFLDFVGIVGFGLLVGLTLARSLPREHRRSTHLALSIIGLGFLLSVLRPFLDRTHDNEAGWGAVQFGIFGLALVVLTWRVATARYLALAGASLVVMRQPLIWRASDEFVRATGDATLAYGAELAKLAAHAVGATGSLLLATALLVVALRNKASPPTDLGGDASDSTENALSAS